MEAFHPGRIAPAASSSPFASTRTERVIAVWMTARATFLGLGLVLWAVFIARAPEQATALMALAGPVQVAVVVAMYFGAGLLWRGEQWGRALVAGAQGVSAVYLAFGSWSLDLRGWNITSIGFEVLEGGFEISALVFVWGLKWEPDETVVAALGIDLLGVAILVHLVRRYQALQGDTPGS